MANYNHHHNNHSQHKEPPIKKFMLGTKELEDKVAEFEYDKGTYIITDVVGEERTEVYKSRNMQEAYTKWNVYIGRKKERTFRRKDEDSVEKTPEETAPRQESADRSSNSNGSNSNNRNYNNRNKRNKNRNNKQKQNT